MQYAPSHNARGPLALHTVSEWDNARKGLLSWMESMDRPTDPLPAGGGSVINRLLNACRLHDRNEHLYSSMRAIFPTHKFNPFLTVMGDICFERNP